MTEHFHSPGEAYGMACDTSVRRRRRRRTLIGLNVLAAGAAHVVSASGTAISETVYYTGERQTHTRFTDKHTQTNARGGKATGNLFPRGQRRRDGGGDDHCTTIETLKL